MTFLRWLSPLLLGLTLIALATGRVSSQTPARGHGAEAHDMELVGQWGPGVERTPLAP